MYMPWEKDGKKGNIQWPKGEVVTQTQGVVTMNILQDEEGNCYIDVNGRLQACPQNPFNGYCYRQDGL